MNYSLYLEDTFGNLFGRYLMRRKLSSKWGDMLLPKVKRMNLKVSVSSISDLWKRFQMSLGHEFIGKKARPSTDSVLDLFLFVEETDIVSYADDKNPYVCSENVGVTLKKLEKVGKILFEWFSSNFLKANADKCHLILSTYEPFSINIDHEVIKIVAIRNC